MRNFKSINRLAVIAVFFMGMFSLAGCSDDNKDPAIAQIDEFIQQQNVDKNKAGWKRSLAKPPQVTFDKAKKYFWHLRTNKGSIDIELMPQVAPMHVSSTIYLTNLGFYNGLSFHRVITGFMAQGGDPMGNGIGGPGYKYGGEFDLNVKHNKPGMLSMANAGPNTDGSQFFLTFKATPHLDGRHTIFGSVVEGMEVLKIIEGLGSHSGKPQQEIKILSAIISVK